MNWDEIREKLEGDLKRWKVPAFVIAILLGFLAYHADPEARKETIRLGKNVGTKTKDVFEEKVLPPIEKENDRSRIFLLVDLAVFATACFAGLLIPERGIAMVLVTIIAVGLPLATVLLLAFMAGPLYLGTGLWAAGHIPLARKILGRFLCLAVLQAGFSMIFFGLVPLSADRELGVFFLGLVIIGLFAWFLSRTEPGKQRTSLEKLLKGLTALCVVGALASFIVLCLGGREQAGRKWNANVASFKAGLTAAAAASKPAPEKTVRTENGSGVIPPFTLLCGVPMGPDLRGYSLPNSTQFVIPGHCTSGIVMVPPYTGSIDEPNPMPIIVWHCFNAPTGAGSVGIECIPRSANGPGGHVERARPIGFRIENDQSTDLVVPIILSP
ncbi:MAG TPA: hypothetical protein VNG29_02825 [Candidatus Paceibacterota bacterium]|nr:hypothetical protein [Candidatus Paceibacterota bacterium]